MPVLSRRALLRTGVAGGLALGLAPRALAVGDDDLALIRLGVGIELLSIAFYRRVLASGRFAAERGALTHVLEHERDHHRALVDVLGQAAPTGQDFAFGFPRGTFASRSSTAEAGIRLEATFLGAYLGAAAVLTDPALRSLVAPVAACEAAHLAFWRSVAGGSIPGRALPFALDIDQASTALAPYGV